MTIQTELKKIGEIKIFNKYDNKGKPFGNYNIETYEKSLIADLKKKKKVKKK